MIPGKIRYQAYLVAVVPLLFLLLLLAIGLEMQHMSDVSARMEQRTQTELSRLDDVRELLSETGRDANLPAGAWTRKLHVMRARMNGDFAVLRSLLRGNAAMESRVTAFAGAAHDGMALIERYARDMQDGNKAAARALLTSDATRTMSRRLASAYEAALVTERGIEGDRLSGLRRAVVHYEIVLIIACVVAIVATLLVSGRFGVRIAQRLAQLAENARRLARGEPADSLRGDDEFAALDRVYQEMMERIAHEHRISTMLQRRLLPQKLAEFEGLRIDTAYVPAAQESEVGGDWYDAFALSERSICISIGDVGGHGLRAATLMAGARLAVRTAARMNDDPASIVGHVNRVICADEPGTLITAVVAVLDLYDGLLRYAVAGHPEPLLIRADRDVQFLPGHGLLLGVDERERYQTYSVEMEEGSALLLYTDGLIENERDYIRGSARLRRIAVEEVANSSDNIAEAIQRRIFGKRGTSDDAAVLFAGVTKLGARVRTASRTWTLDAKDYHSARRAKRAIMWYLGNEMHAEDQMVAAELVLGELLGNVARHTPGPARVTLERSNGTTVMRVADTGEPFSVNGETTKAADVLAESGRGLFLVRSVAQDLQIEHTGGGNVVTAVLGSS